MISGTSHDGIDHAVVDFAVRDGVLHGEVGGTGSTPYPEELRARLMRALPPAALTFAEACELDTLIGQAFAEVAAAAVEAAGGVDLICSHGQTVYHWVAGGRWTSYCWPACPAGRPGSTWAASPT
jgi:anhydro-N-acetylmuramic acid kinase